MRFLQHPLSKADSLAQRKQLGSIRRRLLLSFVLLAVFGMDADSSRAQVPSGSIIAWGANFSGQTNPPLPNDGFVAVSAGADHVLGLKVDGSIVAWGNNDSGQLDVPSPNADFVAVAAGSYHSLGLKASGTIIAWGDDELQQTNVPIPNSDFVAIAAGRVHSLALKANGSIVAWGYSGDGRTAVPIPNGGFIAIAAGSNHSLGLGPDGTIVAWGDDEWGQTDVPEPDPAFVAISAGQFQNLTLRSDGSVVVHAGGAFAVPLPNTDFVAIDAGADHFMALRTDGSIVAWGSNTWGQSDTPAINHGFIGLSAGGRFSVGIRAPSDWDSDGVQDLEDNCPKLANPDQEDCDQDGVGNACVIDSCTSNSECTDCNVNNVPDGCDLEAGVSTDNNFNGVPDECDHVLFVDASLDETGNGTGWCDAFQSLQDALDAAILSDGRVTEIYVAQGTYKPDQGANRTPGDRTASFVHQMGLVIRGGYVGYGSSNPYGRNVDAQPSILSGDLQGDDLQGFLNRTDNSFQVVTATGVDSTALLDGFVISGGHANGSSTQRNGGGVYCSASTPTIRDCTIRDNFATNDGGGIAFCDGPIIGCTIEANHSGNHGGGLIGCDGSIVNCTVAGNEAQVGGGLFGCNGTIVNALILHNQASQGGGVSGGVGSLINGTIVGNFAVEGAAIRNFGGAIANCIIWNHPGTQPILNSTVPTYSDIESWDGSGTANISNDPLFVDADGLDGDLSTWLDNDYRLRDGSPCLDRGDLLLLPPDTLDLDRDNDVAEEIPVDLRQRPRIEGEALDIGAYEMRLDGPVFNLTRSTYHPTIQSAIDDAQPGDEIVLQPGVYVEYLALTRPVTIRSIQPESPIVVDATIIRGTDESGWYSPPVIQVVSGPVNFFGVTIEPRGYGTRAITCVAPLVLDSCVLVDGEASRAISIEQTEIVVRETRFIGRWTELIRCSSGSVAVIDSTLTDTRCWNTPIVSTACAVLIENSNLDRVGGYGGAAFANGGVLTIRDSSISSNTSGNGAIICHGCELHIDNCDVVNNDSEDDTTLVVGGLLVIQSPSATIRNSRIRNNRTHAGAGGVAFVGSVASLDACEITGNSVGGEGYDHNAGGISIIGGNVSLTDCIVSGNFGVYGPGGIYLSGILHTERTLIADNFGFACQEPWCEEFSLGAGADLGFFRGGGRLADSIVGECGGGVDATLELPGTNVGIPEGSSLRVLGNGRIVSGGTIVVENGGELAVQDDAVVDLGPDGVVHVGGLLRLTDHATLRNTRLTIKRGSFEGAPSISNNDITFVETGVPFGQLFIEESAAVFDNVIRADGDRYLDVLPEMFKGTIGNNRIFVRITEGVDDTRGGLFEARGEDSSCETTPDCPSGAFGLSNIPNFSPATWTLERLELVDDAKLNLTNRFDFQAPFHSGGSEEVLYVKDLVLGSKAILNTALQRMYYGSLTAVGDPKNPAENSRIVDVPLLGYSLGAIEFDDTTPSPHNEFDIRVRTRVRDSSDVQSSDCTTDPSTCKEGAVTLDPNSVTSEGGMMEMQTRASYRQPASSVAAKGTFARASGDEPITIAFQYKFLEDPGNDSKIIIYLSDDPDVSEGLRRVGHVRPPAPGLPGSLGSDEFATFFGTFRRHDLNFTRGAYVELELRGQGAHAWIDRWDMQVSCNAVCGDLNQRNQLDNGDYLLQLAGYGQSLNPYDPQRSCLDSSTSADHFAGLDDLLAQDARSNGTGFGGCGAPDNTAGVAVSPAVPVTLPSTNALVFAGKTNLPGEQGDFVFTTDVIGACLGNRQTPASAADPVAGHRSNGRLLADGSGGLYQLHATQGLIRLDNAQVVLGHKSFSDVAIDGGQLAEVVVGVSSVVAGGNGSDGGGVPISDAAFDSNDASIVYVVPVKVRPVDPLDCPYFAAAKLQLVKNDRDGNHYTLVQLYGANPPDESECACDAGCAPLLDKYHPREIEADSLGNVFVTSSSGLNGNDWLLMYDGALATPSEIAVQLSHFDPPVVSPVALALSIRDPNRLYLASSVNRGPTTRIYRFAVQRSGLRATGLTLSGMIDIDNSAALRGDRGLGYVAAIASIHEDPFDGALFVTGFTNPKFEADGATIENQADPNGSTFSPDAPIFTSGTFAVIRPSTIWTPSPPSAPAIHSSELGCDSLALPLSVTSVRRCASSLDVNDDGVVDRVDLPAVIACWSGPGADLPSGLCLRANFDCSQTIDLQDFALFQRAASASGDE